MSPGKIKASFDSMDQKKYFPQVTVDTYSNNNYLDVARWSTYALLIKEVMTINPKTILEAGPGNGLVSSILRSIGFTVRTLDLDEQVCPDYIGDITAENLTVGDFHPDLVIAAEVLEHVEYRDALRSLQNLKSITSQLLITLPYSSCGSIFFYAALKVPFLSMGSMGLKLFYREEKHEFNGQHYWEIGKKEYPLRRVKADMQRIGWHIKRSYLNPEKPYHHFFILVQK